MRILKENQTFNVDVNRRHRGVELYAHCTVQTDYKVKGDGVLWAMQAPAVIQSHYSEADILKSDRLKATPPIKDGDHVIINDGEHIVHVLGNYSNCVIFEPVDGVFDEKLLSRWA